MSKQDQSPFSARVRACAEELARNGVSALGPLYDLAAHRMVRYAVTLTRNQHDAEDAAQTALVQVAMHPQALARARYPWSYFLRVVRNEALDIARRKRRLTLLATMPDASSRPADDFGKRDTCREVWKALRKLPREQAEVVVLKIWEEMTFAEIGRVLDRSPNTVASRYQYAIEKLTNHLQFLHGEVVHD